VHTAQTVNNVVHFGLITQTFFTFRDKLSCVAEAVTALLVWFVLCSTLQYYLQIIFTRSQ